MSNTEPAPRTRGPRNRRPLTGAIRQFLDERGISQSELATRTGYDRKTVWQALNGEPMTWRFLHEIAVVLGVRDDAVMDTETISDPDPEAVV